MSLFGHKKKHKEELANKHKKNHTILDHHSLYNADSSIGPPLPAENWIDNKLLLCVNPTVADYTHTNYDPQVAIPLNTVFQFESSLFRGQAIVRAIGLDTTDKAYFKGRNRKMDFTFQGQFKRRICFDRLYTGQIFEKPFTKLPGQYIISAGIKLVKALAPALKADINSTTPYMMSPLASAAQVFSICKAGAEIALPAEPKEDVSLLDDKFANMKWTDRKAYFHDLHHLKEYYFRPGLVYTISCYTHMLSPTSYSIHALGMKWGIHTYMPSPMQIATVVLPLANIDKTCTPTPIQANIDKKEEEMNGGHTGIGIIEIMESEELECESKETDEEESESNSALASWEANDLSECEFLVNFQVWHTKLVDELYPHIKKNRKHKKSHHFFGSK